MKVATPQTRRMTALEVGVSARPIYIISACVFKLCALVQLGRQGTIIRTAEGTRVRPVSSSRVDYQPRLWRMEEGGRAAESEALRDGSSSHHGHE